jgi:alkanesulfonate monooxygenase SsuD/methylene tetrahydromethanopterin reductase-like flavin-dependent oxidoreductase (luciferase family)
MDIGIGLPNALAGVRGRELVDWAAVADERGFSVLGTIGRIVYHTHEEMIVAAAAAAATERIHMMSTVMIAPPREPALLAKQAATLDHIAEGRFRLGMGTGWRADDYAVMGASFDDRGAALDELIDALHATWSGKALEGAEAPVGPPPYTDGGPPIVLGGGTGRALERAGRRADAWLSAPAAPDDIAASYATVRAAAERAGRPAPRLLAAVYYALGDVQDEVDRNVESYYGFGGSDLVRVIRGVVLRSPEAITETLSALEHVGVEEVCLWPQARGLDQLHALADIAGL